FFFFKKKKNNNNNNKVFDLLTEVLTECIFHSSTQIYTEQKRKKLFDNVTEIASLFSALNEAKSVSNALTLLLDSYTRCVQKDGADKNDLNPLWIVDDLFHMKKKFATLNLKHLEKLCLFFPDILTNMKHISWLIRHSITNGKALDDMNVFVCQQPLSRTKRIVETWLKFMHDSVKPNVVAEVILLYLETCTSADTISGHEAYSYSEYAQFLEEYIKQSIDTAYMKLKDLYDIALILDGLGAQPSHDNGAVGQTEAPELKSRESSHSEHSRGSREAPSEKRGTVTGVGDGIKDKERGLVEYFREEKNRKQWWEYIEEVEMLFRDDAEISKALWQDGIFNIIPE
ncbi:hypothetical protein RFI_11181, partial [Reticulomyxa filosa]